MTRQIITIILPLLAPIIAYIIWGLYLKRKKNDIDAGKKLNPWQQWPWHWLIISGSILMLLSLLFLGFSDDNNLDGKYIPPAVINGELIQGHFSSSD